MNKNPRVFMNIAIQGSNISKQGRLVMELRKDIAPRTAENFLKLCTGEMGDCKTVPSKKLHFKDTFFHRIIPGFMAQGGDITRGDGRGGESIYGRTFPDENFTLKHTGAGDLSMANAGRNTNGSQFFLTFIPCPWLDGNHTVFGKVVEGKEFLSEIEKVGTSSGTPLAKVTITDCGKVEEKSQ